jgi:nucleoside-diphosphate-sugar epimerase
MSSSEQPAAPAAPPIRDAKILVTGPAGQIALPLAARLARDNEVWGVARFGDPASRETVERAGITTRVVDLASGDFGDLPDDFTYVLHLATFNSPAPDFDQAIRVNAEATGFLIAHSRSATVLVMSTGSVYRPHTDPWHQYLETDPLGDNVFPLRPTYAISKIAQEAVARTSARQFGTKVVIARMNVAYGAHGGVPALHLASIVSRTPITLRNDPLPFSPIHDDDIYEQLPALLSVASVPATIVNWAGDEPVGTREWIEYLGELTGIEPIIQVEPIPGAHLGVAVDPTKRLGITGTCRVRWRDGMRKLVAQRYPDGVPDAAPA